MLKLLEKLCAPIAVSGNEGAVCELIRREIEPFCQSVYTDKIGNLYAEKKGARTPKNKIMLAAHMDEVGFIVTSVTETGLIKFSAVGGVEPSILPAKKVSINAKGGIVSGVVGVVPIHLLPGGDKKKLLGFEGLYIDIGADSRDEALRLVSLGDVGVIDGEFKALSQTKILSRALDNRCGCAVLIRLLQSQSEFDFTAVFTVQEEVGCRGAAVAVQSVRPDIAIVLDTTTACDIYGVADDKTVCCLSQGGVLSFMDKGCIYDRDLFNLALKVAEKNGIGVQVKRAVAGGNDSSALQKFSGAVRCTSLCTPSRYLHSSVCTIDKNDLESVFNLAQGLIQEYSEI